MTRHGDVAAAERGVLRLFHAAMLGRGSVSGGQWDSLQRVSATAGDEGSLHEIFADINRDPRAAAGKVWPISVSFLQKH